MAKRKKRRLKVRKKVKVSKKKNKEIVNKERSPSTGDKKSKVRKLIRLALGKLRRKKKR